MEDLPMHQPSTPYTFSKPPPSPTKEPTTSSNGLDELAADTDTGAGVNNGTETQLEDTNIEHEDILAQMIIKGTLPMDKNGIKHALASLCDSQAVAVVHGFATPVENFVTFINQHATTGQQVQANRISRNACFPFPKYQDKSLPQKSPLKHMNYVHEHCALDIAESHSPSLAKLYTSLFRFVDLEEPTTEYKCHTCGADVSTEGSMDDANC